MASVPGLKRRVVSAIILVTVCFVAINFWDDPGPAGQCAPPFLGASCGLFLGVIHFPGSGVTRGSPRACKVAACALIIASTVFAGSYPWHQMPAVGGELGEKSDVWRKRWVMLAAVAILALICVACILKPHPPSTYAHDAKWCVQPVALHDGVPRILCLYGARLHKIRRLPGGIDAQHGECRSWLDCLYLPSTNGGYEI